LIIYASLCSVYTEFSPLIDVDQLILFDIYV